MSHAILRSQRCLHNLGFGKKVDDAIIVHFFCNLCTEGSAEMDEGERMTQTWVPQTRDELLTCLADAKRLLHRNSELNSFIDERRQRLSTRERVRKGKPLPVYMAIGVCIVFVFVTSTPLKESTFMLTMPFYDMSSPWVQYGIWNAINIAIALLIGIPFGGTFVKKFFDKRRKAKNLKIEERNNAAAFSDAEIHSQIAGALNELAVISKQWVHSCQSWYPANYANVPAVDYFYSVVSDRRANTISEMINLYETELHQQRMEAGQQEMIRQQKIGNSIGLANLATDMQTANNTARMARAAERTAASSESAASDLNRIRRRFGA